MGRGGGSCNVYSRNNWDYVPAPRPSAKDKEVAFKHLSDGDWARSHDLEPATDACEREFKELRKCVEANDSRVGPCSWFLKQWRACEKKCSQGCWKDMA